MSGGHFDYGCFAVSRFAEELKHEIDTNYSQEKDDWGDSIGAGYSKKTVTMLKRCHAIIDLAGGLAKEIEWLYSGDHGEETFVDIVKPMLRRKL
uniref:Uncharacterized protein n=1 Tax=viral metagenome TaxID=1070528 RepID=A0A6M3LKZ5_9ZZZZ